MEIEAPRGEAYEDQHVHQVYEQIASHFSSTRYKPWPIVERFLRELPTGSVGLDVGCGNGKYLAVNQNVFIIGSDRSANLTKIASKHQSHSSIVADSLALPHPFASFDFALSIAVIHHFSTSQRRIEAVRAVLDTLKPHTGKALIFVWAVEQKGSRRGWDEGHEQDVMVPWVMKAQHSPGKTKKKGRRHEGNEDNATAEDGDTGAREPDTYLRYYHLYCKGELGADIAAAGGAVVESGYDRDNWWAVASRGRPA